jgi:hypothetical protein
MKILRTVLKLRELRILRRRTSEGGRFGADLRGWTTACRDGCREEKGQDGIWAGRGALDFSGRKAEEGAVGLARSPGWSVAQLLWLKRRASR